MPKRDSKKAPHQAGERLELSIDNLAAGGDGVGKTAGGYTVFVPFSAPGDRLQVSITEARKTYARARVEKVLEKGTGRVDPPCPVAGQCGGCSWQHLDYSAQAAHKRRLVGRFF